MNADAAKRAKIIDKVRALLSMTTENGCTEAEAMTAASMASRLMEQYDLAFGDVREVEDERIAQQSRPFASTDRPREMHAAGIYVAPAVGEFFDCKIWRSYTEIIFFGLRDDVEIAHIMLAMIRFAMDRELSEFMRSGAASTWEHPRSLASSFLRGMGHRVSQRLSQIKAERTANVRAKGKDLVVVKSALVDAAFAAQFPKLTPARPSAPPKSSIAYSAGFAAGDRVSLGQKEVAAAPVNTVPSRPVRHNAPTRPPTAPAASPVRKSRSYSARAVRWIARVCAAVATFVVTICGYGTALGSLLLFNGVLETLGSTTMPKGIFIDWLIVRQPIWAGPSAACIACLIRMARLDRLESLKYFKDQPPREGWAATARSAGFSALHVFHVMAFGSIAYFSNRLAPQIRDQFTSYPDRSLSSQWNTLVLEGLAAWTTWAEASAWIFAGYIIAAAVDKVDRFGRS